MKEGVRPHDDPPVSVNGKDLEENLSKLWIRR
jgi:hypothetical protein